MKRFNVGYDGEHETPDGQYVKARDFNQFSQQAHTLERKLRRLLGECFQKGDNVRIVEEGAALPVGADAVVEHAGETLTLKYWSELSNRTEYVSVLPEQVALKREAAKRIAEEGRPELVPGQTYAVTYQENGSHFTTDGTYSHESGGRYWFNGWDIPVDRVTRLEGLRSSRVSKRADTSK